MSYFTRFVIVLITVLVFISEFIYSQGFYSVFSKDGVEVIAVGKNGNYFRSLDGGINWGTYPMGTADLTSVFVIANNIWVAASNGTVYSSQNGGTNWSNQSVSIESLKSIFFINANTGWTVGSAGVLFKTTNGGVNWSSKTSNLSTDINSIKFSSTLNGTACGNAGKVIYTTDGGDSWISYSTNITGDLLSIDKSGSNIIATGADGFILKYDGVSWTNIDYKIDSKSSVNSVKMLDSNTFYTCGGGGFIRKSTNAGDSFSYQQNPMLANLVNINFYNAQTGWAVSSLNNVIIRTSDGGNTWLLPANTTITYSWTLKQSGTGNIGNGFCLHPSNKNGIFVMMGNNIYRTLNRGENWTLIGTNTIGGSAHSFFVNELDTNLMIAAKGSSGGRITRSTDYGQTWTDILGPINLTSYGMPLEVDQNNPNICYLGPDNSVMKKSTDFGATWTNIGLTTFRSPCDIVVCYENPDILYVGDGTTGSGSGELLKSTNGGVNWTSIHTVTGSEIPMISITSHNPDAAFHTTWSSGGIWKTTDQWHTFTQPATTSNCWATDIAKDDPTAVTYGTYGSSVFLSTNSGVNFTSSTVPSSPEAGLLYYDKGTLFAQHGNGVYKLNINYTVITGVTSENNEIPKGFYIAQNYPNPFNPSTVIEYYVSNASNITVKIFDITGRDIKVLADSYMVPGKYKLNFDGSDLSSGVYFYSLFSNGQKIDSKKMLLIK